jgi:hypothetical protein
MRHVIVIAVAGASLAGCSSVSFDSFKPTPAPVQIQLESTPPGADARTSLGQSCKTPCSVSLPAPEGGFSVTYTMNKFETATVPVQVTRSAGDFLNLTAPTVEPNPVVAELMPAAPPPKPAKKLAAKPKKPAPPKGAAPASPAGSPFPQPPR